MSQKIYYWILKFGSFIAFISVFLVNKNYLFPFITSKQIFFNILVEFLMIFWIALIVKYPTWRPKKNYITFGIIAYFLAILASAIFGVDFNLSFWGDVERMLGLFHVAHFFLFYLILITVNRASRDWEHLMIASVAVATANGIWGVNINQIYTTIGNTSYVAGYMIFNLYFVVYLIIKERNWIIRSLYGLAIIIITYTFFNAESGGAYIGLFLSAFIILFLYAILNKNKKIRYGAIGVLAVGAIIVSFLFINKQASWLVDTKLGLILKDISFEKQTFHTRIISWQSAAKDFRHHPILGVGFGNYAIIFDKYFPAKFYSYTASETYFDRAHNNLIDIASTTGSLGLLAYLSIFAAVGYYLVRGYRKGNIDINTFVLFVGLIFAYFIQNLVVFDSFVTYLSLMIVLGYVYWLAQDKGDDDVDNEYDQPLKNKEMIALIVAGLVMFTVIYQYNYRVSKMLVATIDGQRFWSQGQQLKTYEAYKRALGYDTPLDRDSRSTYVRLFMGGANNFKGLNIADAQKMIDFAAEMAKKNLAYNPKDSLLNMEYAQLMITAAEVNQNDREKFKFYSDQALEYVDKSLESSNERIPVYFVKAQILLVRGEKNKAIETMKYATGLNKDHYEAFCQLSQIYFYLKDNKNGYDYMDKCLDKDGAGVLTPAAYVKSLINHYSEAKDWDRVVKLLVKLTQLSPKDPNVWADLAKIYAQNGQKDEAKQAALKAAELEPKYQKDVEEFIKKLDK